MRMLERHLRADFGELGVAAEAEQRNGLLAASTPTGTQASKSRNPREAYVRRDSFSSLAPGAVRLSNLARRPRARRRARRVRPTGTDSGHVEYAAEHT